MNLAKIIANVFRHRHRWTDTRLNCFGITIEQRCRCGAYRHHLFSDYRGWDEPLWREGKHPYDK